MNKLTLAAQTIKDTVSALDVGNAIGLEIRHGRCQCPFHGGKDFNCVLYKGNRGWYCHVCKQGGDVISFTRQYYNMSFKDCVAWFDDTFHMGLNLDRTIDPSEQRRAEMALQRRKNERELREWKDRMANELYLAAEMIAMRLEDMRDQFRPTTYGAWDSRFCTAVRLLPEALALADDCMMNCIKETHE